MGRSAVYEREVVSIAVPLQQREVDVVVLRAEGEVVIMQGDRTVYSRNVEGEGSYLIFNYLVHRLERGDCSVRVRRGKRDISCIEFN